MNEIEFNLIVKDDLDKLNQLISKGYFETSDFEQQVNVVRESLATLGYVISKKGGKNESKSERKRIQTLQLV